MVSFFRYRGKGQTRYPSDPRTTAYFNAIKGDVERYAEGFDIVYVAMSSQYAEQAAHLIYTQLTLDGHNVADAIYNDRTHALHMTPDRASEGSNAGIIVVDNERNDATRESFRHHKIVKRLTDLGISEVFYTGIFPRAAYEIINLPSDSDSKSHS